MKFSRSLFFTLFLGASFLIGCGMQKEMPSVGASGQLQGEQYFTLKNLAGEDVALKTLLAGKKAVLVNFFATWCPPCREEIPDLIQLHNHYASKGFSVVGVDAEESVAKVSPFVQKFKITYPVLLDSEAQATNAFGLVGIPTTFLIDSHGNIVGEYHAFTPKLVSDVEKLLQ